MIGWLLLGLNVLFGVVSITRALAGTLSTDAVIGYIVAYMVVLTMFVFVVNRR